MVRGASLLAAVATVAMAVAVPAIADCADILPSAQEADGPRRAITTTDLVTLRDIGSPDAWVVPGTSPFAASPDGAKLAFVLTRGDLASNGVCRALVTLPTGGGPPRVVDRGGEMPMLQDDVRGLRMATGGEALVVPAWSPDGRWIAYLKRTGGVTQIWRVRADGSEPRAVTRSATDIDRLAWISNDAIVFASRDGAVAADRARDDESLSGYHYDGRVMTMYALRPLLQMAEVPPVTHVVDVGTGRVRPTSARDAALLGADPLGDDPASAVIVSADGRRAGADRDGPSPLSQRRIWVSDPGGARQECRFAACDGGIVQLWWTDRGDLVFQRREGWARGQMAIYRWRPGTRAPVRVVADAGWLLGCLYRAERLFCTSEQATRPARLVALDLATGRSRILFDPNPLFDRLVLGSVERLPTRNAFGLDSWSDLVLPPGTKPGARLPLVIVQYHSEGFLRGGTGNDYPVFPLAAHGLAVLSVERPPVVGSNRPDLDSVDKIVTAMTADWAERRSILSSVLGGVDAAVARGIVDPARVGITGLSDGMSTVEYGLINTRRFAAAAISTCCEDPHSVMTSGGTRWADWNHAVRHYPLASDAGAAFWKPMSLSLNARSIDVPILMQLADREYLGGLEAFTALREQKKPVDLYVFPDEYHVKWQPRHRLAIYDRAIDWFAFWLAGRRDPDPAKRAQYDGWEALRRLRSGEAAAPAPRPAG